MILAREVLGTSDEPRFTRRRVERLLVRWSEAARPRLRRETDSGTDVAIDLPRGTYLADGTVVADDGQRLIVIVRPPEPAMRVRFDPALDTQAFLRHVALVAHAFGNQHVPLEVEDEEIRLPITTSEHIARETITRLNLPGLCVSVEEMPLGRRHPLLLGDRHG